jgi:hypothetical protein
VDLGTPYRRANSGRHVFEAGPATHPHTDTLWITTDIARPPRQLTGAGVPGSPRADPAAWPRRSELHRVKGAALSAVRPALTTIRLLSADTRGSPDQAWPSHKARHRVDTPKVARLNLISRPIGQTVAIRVEEIWPSELRTYSRTYVGSHFGLHLSVSLTFDVVSRLTVTSPRFVSRTAAFPTAGSMPQSVIRSRARSPDCIRALYPGWPPVRLAGSVRY